MIHEVKLYGGRGHGQVVKTERVRHRYEFVYDPLMGRRNRASLLCRNLSIDDLMNEQLDREYVTYTVQQYFMRARNPRREKVRWIGVLEGCELTQREEHDFQRDFDYMPWSFPSVSFLHEFEEWWSQAVYKYTGRLTWRGEPVYW